MKRVVQSVHALKPTQVRYGQMSDREMARDYHREIAAPDAGGKEPQLRQLHRLIDKHLLVQFLAVAAVALLISMLDVVGVLLLLPLVDLLNSGAASVDVPVLGSLTAGQLVALVVVFFIAKSVSMAVLRWWTSGVILKASARTASALLVEYMRAPLSFHISRNSADAVRSIVVTVRSFFDQGVMGVVNGVAESMTLVALTAVIIAKSPLEGAAGFAFFAISSLFFVKLIQSRTRSNSRKVQDLTRSTIRLVTEGVGAIDEYRVRGSQKSVEEDFRVQRLRLEEAKRLTVFAGELSRYYLEVLFIGAFGVVAGVALATKETGEVIQTLALVLAVGFRVLPSVSRVLGASNSVKIGQAAYSIILEEFDEMGIDRLRDREGTEASSETLENGSVARVAIDDLKFTYDAGAVEALSIPNLQIEAGTSLGVVGSSGAGKSTLVSLLCGLRTPTSGTITIDSVAASEANAVIGYVPQEVFLIDGSVLENIQLGLDLSEEDCWRALRDAQLDQFVRSLPHGINSLVGERGSRISGGQRQRLGLARALAHSPSLLILDEATAALDVQTEAAVMEAIELIKGSVTIVIVAHRLSTVRDCDQIAYLEDGELRGVGHFDELRDLVPEFDSAVMLSRGE